MYRRAYGLLAPRAYSVILFCALFCTLTVKLFHAGRFYLLGEYPGWILADVAVLLGLEIILMVICFRWPRRWIVRTAVIAAAIVCTWSVMNAGCLIRTGTQILPRLLLPLFRDPLNVLLMIAANLAKMPVTAVLLLGPSIVLIAFFISVLTRPVPLKCNRRHLTGRIVCSLVVIFIAVASYAGTVGRGSAMINSVGLHYNCHLQAVISLIRDRNPEIPESDFQRIIPAYDRLNVARNPLNVNYNVIVVVLEGIQYKYTSLAGSRVELTPYLAGLAHQGVEFTHARSTLTHTTKALFSLLTGRFPSVSHDIAEAVPARKFYASIATVLSSQLDYRTAFFQSAKGNFESRPGLVYNLGFDKFWTRDDLDNTESYLGYLACDEFAMLEPITEWIQAEQKPFFLTVLCSVTHDPYEVPEWFDKTAREPIERYRQTIFYTDKFLAALDVGLAGLNLTDNTILCIISDHGEAFGEHGLLGHERIAFEEVLHIPWVIRAPFLVEPGTKIATPVSSVDVTPTLLGLLGFDTGSVDFDGVNVLANVPGDRKSYFSGWMQEGPVGFVRGCEKFVYNPADERVSMYDLRIDPYELNGRELTEQQAQEIAREIIAWRRNSIFRIDQQRFGKKTLFNRWLCDWTGRVSYAKYQKPQ